MTAIQMINAAFEIINVPYMRKWKVRSWVGNSWSTTIKTLQTNGGAMGQLGTEKKNKRKLTTVTENWIRLERKIYYSSLLEYWN